MKLIWPSCCLLISVGLSNGTFAAKAFFWPRFFRWRFFLGYGVTARYILLRITSSRWSPTSIGFDAMVSIWFRWHAPPYVGDLEASYVGDFDASDLHQKVFWILQTYIRSVCVRTEKILHQRTASGSPKSGRGRRRAAAGGSYVNKC